MKKRALGIMLLAVDALVVIAALAKDVFVSMFNPFDVTAFIILAVAIIAAIIAIVLILTKVDKPEEDKNTANKK